MLLTIGAYINYRIAIIMRIKSVCAAIMVLVFVSAGNSYADQKIKTKSNIKNDRVVQPVASSECTEICAEGEQCVKSPTIEAVSSDAVKSYCVAVSEEKSSAASAESQ
ncbi:hypothetical protein [Cellvibrio sp. UBA7671]|uniref:hypothetical protein n=1 Tax=Cellvibrio sp. UBA7671 TaxID=1946312 RepID=UPI002F355E1F